MWILVILLYLLGCIPTYCLTDGQSTFNKVWYTIFWPATVLLLLITLFKKFKLLNFQIII